MNKDISSKLLALKARRQGYTAAMDSMESYNAALELFEHRGTKDHVKYALGIMQEVDSKYTKTSISEGERVKSQIKEIINTEVTFEYQGSVPLNVHIRGSSDIDILVLLKNCSTFDPSGIKANKYSPWHGPSTLDQLCLLRQELESELKKAFYSANVDTTGDKSISLSGGSLKRKIDVVPSHWHHSKSYQESNKPEQKEVCILQKKSKTKFKNRPFLHISEINKKDKRCSGNVKKIIRMLKNIKEDSYTPSLITLNSYEIAGLVFHFEESSINFPPYQELALVAETRRQLDIMIATRNQTMRLMTPDGIRKIIDTDEKFESIKLLRSEVNTLVTDLAKELTGNNWLNDIDSIQALQESYIPNFII